MKGYQDRQNSTIFAQMELEQDLGFILKGLKLRGMFNTNRKTNYSIDRTYKPYYFAKNPFARPDMSRAGKRLYRTKGRSEGNQ